MHESDDFPHSIGPEPNFNESMYFQFAELASGLNGFVRLANRPNEGRGERTICLFCPDGRVGFSFSRPIFADPAILDAGGVTIEIQSPFKRQHVSYVGDVSILDNPAAMRDPRAALTGSPTEPALIELTFTSAATAWADSLDKKGDFVANHYEQFMTVDGTVDIGGQVTHLAGRGLRDHSWGPRSWQAPYFYRWIHGSRDSFGFAAGILGSPDGEPTMGGFIWEGEDIHPLDEVDIRTTWAPSSIYEMQLVSLTAVASGRRWSLSGKVETAIPLRSRTADGTTRILENSMRWSHEGEEMLGIAECLDQIIDGEPVGVAAYDQ
jgi:hypothetical protein